MKTWIEPEMKEMQIHNGSKYGFDLGSFQTS